MSIELNIVPPIVADYSFAYNVLMQVIPYLNIADLVACSQVCAVWRSIVKQAPIWSKYKLKSCGKHLKSIVSGVEKFVGFIEVNQVSMLESAALLSVLQGAENVVQLSLAQIEFELVQKLKPAWESLEMLKVNTMLWDVTDARTLNFYKYAENLSSLTIESAHPIVLEDLNALQHLKHLYVDVDYCHGFFRSKHTFLERLESLGVGYSCYKTNTDIKSLYNNQLSDLLRRNLKNLRWLKLSNLENDFLILVTVARHPKLEQLDLTLTNAWNYYSFFLAMCTNIKRLSVTLMWPQERISSIPEIAVHNSILIGTVRELKGTLNHFTWNFHAGYLSESEVEIAIENNKWRPSCTAVWEDVSNLNPCAASFADIRNSYKDISYVELSLLELEKVVARELPEVQVKIKSDKYRGICEFCPEEPRDNVSMRLLKILRIDRQKARWMRSRFCHLPLYRVAH